nr:pentatricopeptide repeat-containing protein [Tanacetum cinerariifolium]
MTPSSSRFLLFDVHYDGIFNFKPLRRVSYLAEEEAAVTSKAKEKVCDDDITVTSVVDKGKGLVDKGKEKMVDEGNVVKSRKSARSTKSGIVIEENANPTFSEDDDSDSDLDMEQMFKGNTDLEEMFKGNTDSESEYSDKFVGEKYVDADQLKECQTYYALANRFPYGEITTEDHYATIKSYVKAILDSNDGCTVKLGVIVNPDDKTYFDGFYCCFNGLKKGLQIGYIDMPIGNGLTLISGQHKGLIEVVKDVMPLAEHRQCARHIYEG